MSDIKLEFCPDNMHFKFIAYRRGFKTFRATTLTKALTKCFKGHWWRKYSRGSI